MKQKTEERDRVVTTGYSIPASVMEFANEQAIIERKSRSQYVSDLIRKEMKRLEKAASKKSSRR